MKLAPAVLISLLIAPAAPALRADPPVKAAWKPYVLTERRYRGYECAHAQRAVEDILEAVGARRARVRCYWREGLVADWEALSSLDTRPGRAVLSALMEREQARGGAFSGLAAKWASAGSDDGAAVDARWRKASLQFLVADLRLCNIHSEVIDWMLGTLDVRNVAQTVFCNPGSGYINASFEHLVPADGPNPVSPVR